MLFDSPSEELERDSRTVIRRNLGKSAVEEIFIVINEKDIKHFKKIKKDAKIGDEVPLFEWRMEVYPRGLQDFSNLPEEFDVPQELYFSYRRLREKFLYRD